ncbi:MAG: hypothetical protein IJO54_06920 [Oscillospiraceae bacterium]|nr:hypothetical protein [Oscillospiraceae bacterium]
MYTIAPVNPKRDIRTAEYTDLAGVDFSQEAANVDSRHSPYCLNMISDNGKNPVKRTGWQTQLKLGGSVHNLWFCKLGGKSYCIVHAGTRLYTLSRTDGSYTATLIRTNVADKKGCGFFFREGEKDGFYILTGGEYLVFDGKTCREVRDAAYVPTTIIARSPSGGGEAYEDINLLSGRMRELFTGDDKAKVYQLGHTDIETVNKVEKLLEDGSTQTLTADVDYTVDAVCGRVTFTAAHKTPVEGQDNIYITYTKSFRGYGEKIAKATQFCTYGVGGSNRVFLTGNPDFAAYDFWSDVYRPSYFPDLNYAIIGNADTAVMGYLKIGGQVAVVKESTGQDTAIFIRSGTQDSSGNALFTAKEGIVGIGAVSKNAFAVLGDDPLFFSTQGVYAVSPSNLSYERVTRSRSRYIDSALRTEPHPENAVACIWNGCYLLAVNGNVYLLDGRKKNKNGTDSDYSYECWFWDNVPASCLAADFNGRLWFGTADGRVCSFKTEAEGIKRFSDDGAPIRAVWSTPFTDDGLTHRFKTLQKKGCLALLAPYSRSSCTVYYLDDSGRRTLAREGRMDISSFFEEIDFTRISFDASEGPREVHFNRRHRRYRRLQLIFENNTADEGFGIYKIVKTFEAGNYSKNRR